MKIPTLRDRTHTCGELRAEHEGRQVLLMGWVAKKRDLGGAVFVDLRDRYGVTQVVFLEEKDASLHARAGELGHEDIIAVRGEVVSRGDNATDRIATGAIEVHASDLVVMTRANPLPFPVRDDINTSIETRFRYRYLDLRRPEPFRAITIRARTAGIVRNYLESLDFLEIDTPYLVKYTPGGARNFLVPSRLHEGKYYALSESPQIFKQLLMSAGFERYYQIARCFRDEDPRHDRQVEFTQIDLEMAFVGEEEIHEIIDGLVSRVWKEIRDVELPSPLPSMTWKQAMELYGTDKPDTRFGLELHDLRPFAEGCGIGILENAPSEHLIKGLVIPDGAGRLSRKAIDTYTEFVKRQEVGPAKGLFWLKMKPDGSLQGPGAKNVPPQKVTQLREITGMGPGDALFAIVDEERITNRAMDQLRRRLGRDLDLIDDSKVAALWVTEFPMFELGEDGTWTSGHHPFTMPHPDDLELLREGRMNEVRAQAYDLVINGYEVGGGSIRVHDPEIQQLIFRALGLPEEMFAFMIEALGYGFPPHGGFAAGLDRMVMLLAGQDSIREVIPFPKTMTGVDLMTGAPSAID